MNSFRVSFTPPTVLVSGDFYWKSKDGILMYIERAFADLHGCLDLLSYADSYIERHFTEVTTLYRGSDHLLCSLIKPIKLM